MSNQFEKKQVEEGIGPGNIGGMGPIQLPTDTEPGSGDVPSGRKSKEDEDDEKEKVKKMKDFIPTFEAFISEARDLNDPIAMRLRAAKAKANKKQAEPAKKEMSPAKAKKLAKLQAQRAEIMKDMEQEAEMEGGEVADRYGDMLNKIDKQIAKLQESVDVILEMDSEGVQSLADELSAEVYTARLKAGAKSATIKATTTTKTWDDGAPVLKYLARGKATNIPFTLYQRPFTVLHDVANGWFYFTDGRKWYGLHGDEGYFEPEDLPFDMEISEDVVTEGYGEFIKAKNLTDIVNLSKEKKRAVFYVTDDNNSRIGAFYLKNGKFAKATSANPSYDLQNNKTTLRDRDDVIYKYKVDESVSTEDVNEARSITKIQKEWGNVTAMMKDAVAAWKKAEGQEKEDLLDQLKVLTTSKKKLEAELNAAVGLKDIDAELE